MTKQFSNQCNAKTIKAIIFDLGGVLYRIDHSRTREAFAALGNEPDFSLLSQHRIFDEYDRGRISTPKFLQELRKFYKLNGTDEDMVVAWNALLLGIINKNVMLLQRLREKYPLYLLSNINELHHRAILPECAPLFEIFENKFFSYQLGMRKPDAEIYEAALQSIGYKPSETLFIDDAPQNIASARQQGIAACHLKKISDLPEILEQLF